MEERGVRLQDPRMLLIPSETFKRLLVGGDHR